MGDEKKEEVQPATYVGTVKVNIRDKDYYVHISPPPMGATLEDLEKALQSNRDMIDTCQAEMKQAFVDQVYLFKLPMQVNYDTPTQNAIMAHLNINVLIPLINIRGGSASFSKAETFHVKQRVEIMRNVAERMAHMERHVDHNPVPTALVAVLVVSTVIFALFIN
jgi:hypothetical protein